MRCLFVILLGLFFACPLFGQGCYSDTRSQGVAAYNKGQYSKAKEFFEAAGFCLDKPASNDLDSWISKCRTAQQEAARRQAEAERKRRESELQQQLANKGYIEIVDVLFSNMHLVDTSVVTLDGYGTCLYASDMRYLTPKIYYNGLVSERRKVFFETKLYDSDGALVGEHDDDYIWVKPGQNHTEVMFPLGNNTRSIFSPGEYRYEVWHNGNRLFSKTFSLHRESTTGIASRGLSLYGTSVDYVDKAQGLSSLVDAVKEWKACRTGALTETGTGIVVYGGNGYSSIGIPSSLSEKLQEINAEKLRIKDVTITNDNTYWCIVYGGNSCYHVTPSALSEKIKEYVNNGEEIYSVSINESGGWAIVTEEHYAASTDFDLEVMEAANEKFGMILSVCTTKKGIVVCCKNGVYYEGIPSNVEEKLKELDYIPRIVKYTDGGTYLITDGESLYSVMM